jgi:hypothetical protein
VVFGRIVSKTCSTEVAMNPIWQSVDIFYKTGSRNKCHLEDLFDFGSKPHGV